MMPALEQTHGRRKVIVGLFMAVVLCSASQLCWKYATMGVPEGASAVQTLALTFSNPIFWCAAALYIWQFFNWMMVLKYADLSFAQPIMACTYVVVGLAAWLVFRESLPPHRIIGILMILGGVYLISRSPHRSTPRAPAQSASLQEAA
jgi:multidrug transporter EmrE-like cation transporter